MTSVVAAADPTVASITIGVTGAPSRAWVAPWGDVTIATADASPTLSWFVAAEDRWHVPAESSTIRQRRIDGTPVVETRLRIPDGDAVQRVWSVADSGGLMVVEIENDSPLPFAVAFSGAELLTERPPAAVPIQGIDLPADSVLMPVGHHASIRVAVSHRAGPIGRPGRLPSLGPHLAVVRGWLAVTQRASRLVLPDEGLVDAVTAARCDLLLDGPVDATDDACGFLLDVAELGRLGDDADAWMPEIVEPIAAIARSDDPSIDRVLQACERLARQADDQRAAADIARVRARRVRDGRGIDAVSAPVPFSAIRRGASAGRFVRAVERGLADGASLMPAGIPSRWLGSNFEVHDVPTGSRSTVSYAVRWHGERPAVLWEQQGVPQLLTAAAIDPAWSSSEASGEALWAAPARPTRLALAVDQSTSDAVGHTEPRSRPGASTPDPRGFV